MCFLTDCTWDMPENGTIDNTMSETPGGDSLTHGTTIYFTCIDGYTNVGESHPWGICFKGKFEIGEELKCKKGSYCRKN